VSLYFQAKSFVKHWLLKVDDHSIHSPFFFDFYQTVLHKAEPQPAFKKLEQLRTDLLSNQTQLVVADFGTGPIESKKNTRSLSYIANTSLAQKEYCELYFRIANHLKAKKIVELGTSLGLTTLYLAEQPQARVYTFEGCHAIANVALTNFEYFEKSNIKLIEGNISTTLADFIQETEKINLALMDANHRYAPTINYFNLLLKRVNENSIIVLDDIHRSKEMEQAWEWIKEHELVYGTIDLYQCGIVFFDPSLNRQHFVFSLHKKRSKRNR
jgi:predicted O-methyltransferase YrrM